MTGSKTPSASLETPFVIRRFVVIGRERKRVAGSGFVSFSETLISGRGIAGVEIRPQYINRKGFLFLLFFGGYKVETRGVF